MPFIGNEPNVREALQSALSSLQLTEKYLVKRGVDKEDASVVGRTEILPAIRDSKQMVEECLKRGCK